MKNKMNMQSAENYGFANDREAFLAETLAAIRIPYRDQRLRASLLDTPLGTVIAIADQEALYLLDFIDYPKLSREITKLCIGTKSRVVAGSTAIIDSISAELKAYFSGELHQFNTPYKLVGSHFQQAVWNALANIAYGQVSSYKDQAALIGRSTAIRAVASACGSNTLVFVIPCHRVISSNGALTGYRCGLERKKWLIDHEKECAKGDFRIHVR